MFFLELVNELYPLAPKALAGRCDIVNHESNTSAMEFAHNNRVIHRDLKPSNIMVQTDVSDKLHAMVVDFGIAKLVGENGNNDMTKTGEVFGSPTYMSPEQCYGTPLDGRTDIYSMGCVLYELLTEKPPFEAESTIDLLMMHVNQAHK